VHEPGLIQGRYIGAAELDEIRRLLADHPNWSRFRLSRQLATLWHWCNPAGQLKDMAARTLMQKLHQRGWIELPPPRGSQPKRLCQSAAAEMVPIELSAISESLGALLPLTISELSTAGKVADRSLFGALLRQHHYLGHRGCVGQNLQYLVRDRQGRPLACVLFGAAAWQCAQRDHYIGWDSQTRQRHLNFIISNTRFLLLASAPQLASHLLSQIARQISPQWQSKYGHRVYLLESFVQRDRFLGTAYRAANWVCVGQTKGRSRQDQPNGGRYQLPLKDIYLYPLHPRFRERLHGKPTSDPNDHCEHPQKS
jgi:hypothetical protein